MSISLASGILQTATAAARTALASPDLVADLTKYYRIGGGYAGATFAHLGPINDDRITAVDLLATSTLNVKIEIRAIRALLEDEVEALRLSELLAAIAPKALQDATDDDFVAMESFYSQIKAHLGRTGSPTSNPWVTASKLAARKRPALFPVRDRVVCDFLGIRGLKSAPRDWTVFQYLIRDDEILSRLTDVRSQLAGGVANGDLRVDDADLRMLDAALWMFARKP